MSAAAVIAPFDETFEACALPHLDELRRAAMRLTNHAQDAEDLVQETWVRAYRSFAQYKTGTNCRAWLHRILRNAWFTRFERRKVETRVMTAQRTVACTTVDPDSVRRYSDPERALAYRGLNREVHQALEAVPEPYRAVVVLVDLQGLSYKEAARELGVANGTVMSRLHRGRRKLRDSLGSFAVREGYVAS